MDNYLYRLIGSIGTLISTIVLIDLDKHTNFINGVLALVVVYAATFLIVDLIRALRSSPRSFDRSSEKGKEKIADYLVKQLQSSGSVVIFSKDLTWVKPNSVAENMLRTKARANELILYVEQETKITKVLKGEGADIRLYHRNGFSPTSRFTILDHRSGKPQVMIGIPEGKKHLIKHYASEDQEVVDLAKDFVALLNSTAKAIK